MSNEADEESLGASREILRRLTNIEKKVGSIDETNAFSMRSNRDAHQDQLKQLFGRSKRRAQVYLAANGRRAVGEIAEHLGMKRQNVTIELQTLEKEGLLSAQTSGSATYWNKKPIDWALGISDLLIAKFKLDPDGNSRR